MKLIEDAKNWSKFWSVRLSIAGGAILTFAEGFPNAVQTTLNAFPDFVHSYVDDGLLKFVGIALVLVSPIARVIKQRFSK